MSIDLQQAFPAPTSKRRNSKRMYDVRITLNNSGKNSKQTVRFGLLNKAAEEARKHKFVEVSDIEYTKSKLYFRFHEDKLHANMHCLSSSANKDGSPSNGRYFAITPSDVAEKMYRMNWIGKTYKLQFDADNDLFYIENAKEATT